MTSVRPDVVVVGAGIAGASLAALCSRAGLQVVVLEQQATFRDRVRGETMALWGVAESARAGLLDTLLTAEARFARRSVHYDEVLSPAEAEERSLDLGQVVPGVPGQLNLSHPAACQALLDAAVAAGARVHRPARGITITPGDTPEVHFVVGDTKLHFRPRLVVGADGRNSQVRRQLDLQLQATPISTFGWGLLVDGVEEWPADTVTIGAQEDLLCFIFPRQDHKVRLYLLTPPEQHQRFAGPDAADRFLTSVGRFTFLPHAAALAAGKAAGPCAGYPMRDTWNDHPYTPGVVLIGDAAGYSDPIIGQGLALAVSDAHHLAGILTGSDHWQTGMLAPYASHRAERMRRLRVTAATFTRWRATFTPQGRLCRRATFDRLAADPINRLPIAALLVGPAALPPEAFGREAADRLLAA